VSKTVRGNLSSPPSRRRATAIQALGGYAITSITIVQGLLLIPLYLHYIGAHMYGLWLASGGLLGMLGMMDLGINSLVIQRVASAYGQQKQDQAGAYFINGVAVYLLICVLYAAVGWLVSIWLPDLLKATGSDTELLRGCFQLALLAMVLGIFNGCLRGFAQALLRPAFPMSSMAGSQILGIVVTVVLLFQGAGLWAIPIGMLTVEGLIFGLNLIYTAVLYRRLAAPISWDADIVKEYVRTSPALVMSRLGNTLSQESQPLLITVLLSPEITTAYMLTRRAADIVFRLLSVIVGSSSGPFAHLAGEGDNKKTGSIAGQLLALSASLGLIGFATYVGANSAFISLWVGTSFVLSQGIILFIGIGYLVRTIRGIMGQLLFGLGDFVYPSIMVLFEGLFTVGLSVLLLNILGVAGVPLALAISASLSGIIIGVRLRGRLPAAFNYTFILKLLFSALLFFAIVMNLAQMDLAIDSWGGFVLLAAILLASLSIVYGLLHWKMSKEKIKGVMRRL